MNEPQPVFRLREELLQYEDSLQQPQYLEHRMKLESELNRLEQREKFVRGLCKVLIVTTVILMFVGGSEVLGGFDPWNDNANMLSISLGIIYVIFAASSAMMVAYYYSNLRPTMRNTRDALFQHSLNEMAQALDAIRDEVRSLKNRTQ